MMKPLILTGLVAGFISTAVVANEKGKETYDLACGFCHNTGVSNSPKLGDKEVWKDRIEAGADAMYETALKGKGAMPAKGGNASLSDDDVKAAVDYMIAESK